ncbi:hypothetical protein A2U01_0058570, partial [Trifolium medium]|nr:hypothetical protein [Trifolium medium]
MCMAPKKPSASDKKRKTEASTSKGTSRNSDYDASKFIGPEQAQ